MPHVGLSDGLRMAYQERGTGSPLLLVHGWAAHGGFFKPQLKALSANWRVIAVDLRGHGQSLGGTGRQSPARLADDMAEFIEALDLQEIVAVGWSMGAMVLWDLCLRPAGKRVAGLVIEDMSPRIINDAGWSLGLRGGYDRAACDASVGAMKADWPGYCRMLARSMLAPGVSRERLSAFVEAELVDQPPGALADLWRDLAGQDYRDVLAGIGVPALIIHGRFGLYEPETARYLERALPDARTLEFANSGHAPHLEEPELFNAAITGFAAEALRQPAAAVGADA